MCYISVRPGGTPTTSSAARVNSSSTSPPKSWHALRTGAAYVLAATTTNFGKQDLLRFRRPSSKAPVVAEAPLSIECRVRQILPLGSHDLFLAEVW